MLLAFPFRRPRADDPARRVTGHRAAIERLARRSARRGGFRGADIDDFVSVVFEHLIEDDYAVVRKHRGTSSFVAYAAVVVENLLRDERDRRWGRFRPSAAACRLGADAVRLEQLVVRDGLELSTAIEMMRRNEGCTESPEALHEMVAAFPPRLGRATVGEVGEGALERHGDDGGVETRVADDERLGVLQQVQATLDQAFAGLGTECVLLLKMHLADGFSIARIARIMGRDQRGLYSHKDRCLASMRGTFEARGLTWEQVREILGWSASDLRAADFGGETTMEAGA